MIEGIYEELVTQLVAERINLAKNDSFYIEKSKIDKAEASTILSRHLSLTIKNALNLIKGETQIEVQIKIANKIIRLLRDELRKEDFEKDLIEIEGEILKAVFSKIDTIYSNLNFHLKEITPYSRLTHSELFTGGNAGISLESELKKEIRSSNEIDLLVSFIKFKGIIILSKDLEDFTNKGGKLRVITTTYMGASDYKAIQLLSRLRNTEVKISYNTGHERLHAKAYLFKRNTGFHTGYIGSSNFSRSALTDGLEWNLKVTAKEVSHIIDKFQKTFETYWQSSDFELFDEAIHSDKLSQSLRRAKSENTQNQHQSFFDIKPFHFQEEILEVVEVERTLHQRNRNLIVAATGTGKTIISAFDYKRFKKQNKSARLLFIAHRKEILEQALSLFRGVIRDNNFGELWVDGNQPKHYDHVFASVQTLNNRLSTLSLSAHYYDFLIVDECHHMTAKSYRGIINYFQPKVLLGLTATPERMDGGDIQEDFCNRIAAEIRLPEALNRKLLCPFQYFGVSDNTDLSKISWEKGKYSASELSSVYTSNDLRVRDVIQATERYTKDINDNRALGFCVTIEHAKYMAEKFSLAGLRADYLTSRNSEFRDDLKERFRKKEINYLFVVDIFNEGIDIPEIDTVLFLRPTESLTIFLQQLGRGLRLADEKECLTVLDFVGNSRPEYNFETKFRALIGKTSNSVSKEIEDNFPHLPLGCSILLERKAKDIILNNINTAALFNRNQLLNKLKNFQHQTTIPLTLKNFMELNLITLQIIYKKGGWKKLCYDASLIGNYDDKYEKEIIRAISTKWLSGNSSSYFKFIKKLADSSFDLSGFAFEETEKQMLLMLYYDIWQSDGIFDSIETSFKELSRNKILIEEIKEVLDILLDNVKHHEIPIELPFKQPLKVHSRYTRDQILAAFGLSTFEKKSSSREGVAENQTLNTELLFINLIKSEENFSPTTMYDDYAINETLFHWQSQNAAGPETSKGLSYINHKKDQKIILLFVREKNKDEYGNTMGYVFVGMGQLTEHYGSKPMNIKWELNEPLPHYLWKDVAKLRVG
jgi:superfamily II DNA or RNA helicase